MPASRSKGSRNPIVKPSRRAAFYDLDGTLLNLDFRRVAFFIFGNLAELNSRFRHLLSFTIGLGPLYLAERSEQRGFVLKLFEFFEGVSMDRLYSLGEEYCQRVLSHRLYPQALDLLQANRVAGLEPVLVTWWPDFIVAPIARRLEVKNFGASRLVTLGNRATGHVASPIIASSGKADWCRTYIREHGLDPDRCWAYADSFDDLAFLSVVGNAVAVNPDPRLLSGAAARGWPVLRFDAAGAANHELDFEDDVLDLSRRTAGGGA